MTPDCDQEKAFYRQQADQLGGQLLRLKEDLTTARRDLRRQRTVATVVRTLFKLARGGLSADALAERFLATLLETLSVDRAALLELQLDGRLRLARGLGFPPGFADALCSVPTLVRPCPETLEELPEAAVKALRESSELDEILWVGHRRSGSVLLLGTPAARRLLQAHFEAADAAPVAAALEVYVHIRELLAAEAALRTSEANYRSIFDNVNDGIAVVDPDNGALLEVNERLEEIFSLREPELTSLSLSDLGRGEKGLSRGQWQRHIELTLRGWPQLLEWPARRPSGQVFWVELNLRTAIIGETVRLLAVARDVTQRKNAEEQLRHGALHDALTGLPNRTLALDRLTQAIQRQQREPGFRFAVMFMDLDRFKMINDSLGHGVGDQLLVAIARRLRQAIRPGDTLARLGGDEFLVLQADVDEQTDAEHLAERLQRTLRDAFLLSGREVYSSASIGIALSSAQYRQPEEMLRDADIAMYQAKSQGTSQHAVFQPSMHHRMVERLQLEEDLRQAVVRDELRAHYQPLVDLSNGQVSGFEALVRWQHPQRGLLMPGAFIATAEETGLVQQLGEWMLRRACRDVHQWLDCHPALAPFTVSVNLSRKQIGSPGLVEFVEALINESGCPRQRLHLEITESLLMDNAILAREVLSKLRDLGLHLSMDDFGTGYSSLSYLHQFPIDILKIDRSFIQRMEQSAEGRQMVGTIINLGHNLGMRVVAEGVETRSQVELVRELGCDFGQGYYFAAALPPEEAERWLVHGRPGDDGLW